VKLPYSDFAKAKDFTCLGSWCLFAGPEQYLKREALAGIRQEAERPGEEATWEVMSGADLIARDLLNRCQTGGLFGGARVIVVQEADRIPADEQERLAKAVGPLPREVAVVLVTSEVGDRVRRRGLGAKLQRAVEQAGLVIEFPPLKAAAAAAWAAEQAKRLGKRLEPAAARKLVEQKVGTRLGEIELEVEKLAQFVGEVKTITSADVDAVSPRLVEEDVWGLIEAVGRRNAGRAVGVLRGLLTDRREDPTRLLGMLARSIRMVWQAKLLMDRGWRPGQEPDAETVSLLPADPRRSALAQFSRFPWQARRSMAQAAVFSWEQLTRALQALSACDLAIKGIQGKVGDPALAMELLVIQLCTDMEMPIWARGEVE